MKQTVQLDSKDIRVIIANYLGVPLEDVIPNRYSFSISNLDAETIASKLEIKQEGL